MPPLLKMANHYLTR